MEPKRTIIALSAGLVLAACSADDADPARGADALAAGSPAIAVQFIPAVESEYPRQESPLQFAGHHYRLRRSLFYEGTLEGDDGSFLSGRVRFSGADVSGALDPASIRSREVEVSGGSFIADLAPGWYVADLVPDQALWPAQRQPIELTAESKAVNFTLRAGAIYSGTVSDAAGQPLAGVLVRAVSPDGSLSSRTVATNANGRYQIAIGPDTDMTYRLEFAREDQAVPRVTFDALPATDPTVMDVQYFPVTTVTVTGKVLGGDDKPAADVSVVFAANDIKPIEAARRNDRGVANTTGEAVFRAKTDAAGTFSISLPKGGWVYSLTLQPPLDRPYGGKYVSAFDFASNGAVYVLDSKRAVSGKVVDPDGKPVGLAEVIVIKTVSLKDNQQVVRFYTDSQGYFAGALDASVPAYDVTVIPLRGGFARCTRAAVDLSAFAEAFIVHPGVRTTGYVEDENGKAVPRVSVTVVARGDVKEGVPARILAEAVTPSDSRGFFELYTPVDPTLTGCRSKATPLD